MPKTFFKKKKTNISLHYTSISRLVNRPMGVSKILSEGPRSKSFFLNTGKVLSAFLPELTFALMVQKQWWVKLLAPGHKSRRCHETVGEAAVITVTHSQLKKEIQFFKMSLWSNNSSFIASWPFLVFCVTEWAAWNRNPICSYRVKWGPKEKRWASS